MKLYYNFQFLANFSKPLSKHKIDIIEYTLKASVFLDTQFIHNLI